MNTAEKVIQNYAFSRLLSSQCFDRGGNIQAMGKDFCIYQFCDNSVILELDEGGGILRAYPDLEPSLLKEFQRRTWNLGDVQPQKVDRAFLKNVCKEYGQAKIARHIGIKETTLSLKLADPTKRLWLREFLIICELINVDYKLFIQPDLE